MKNNIQNHLKNKDTNLKYYSPGIDELSSFACEKIKGLFDSMKSQEPISSIHSRNRGSWNNKEIVPAGSVVMYAYHGHCGEVVSTSIDGISLASGTRVVIGTLKRDTEIRNISDEMTRMIKGHCSGEVSAKSLLVDEIYF